MAKKGTKKEWWETAFDEKYLKTYVDIVTPKLTTQQILFLRKNLKLKRGTKILDLACGYGRHSIALAKHGYHVTGIDASEYFTKRAKKEAERQGVKATFLTGDMRRLSYKNKFDAVINIFTSFGYFKKESDNNLVLKKISQALKPKGQFLIDLNNTPRVLMRMAQEGKINKKTGLFEDLRKDKLSNGIAVTTKHEFSASTMRWLMTRTWKEKGKIQSYQTNVRMYTLPEIKHLMEENGFRIKKIWGDFEESPLNSNAHRLIILAKKM